MIEPPIYFNFWYKSITCVEQRLNSRIHFDSLLGGGAGGAGGPHLAPAPRVVRYVVLLAHQVHQHDEDEHDEDSNEHTPPAQHSVGAAWKGEINMFDRGKRSSKLAKKQISFSN